MGEQHHHRQYLILGSPIHIDNDALPRAALLPAISKRHSPTKADAARPFDAEHAARALGDQRQPSRYAWPRRNIGPDMKINAIPEGIETGLTEVLVYRPGTIPYDIQDRALDANGIVLTHDTRDLTRKGNTLAPTGFHLNP